MDFEYWYMFFIGIVVATTAMASGVGGATFFAPIFVLGLHLSPEVAIGTGLITEVFGFSSGLYAYFRKGLIAYPLGLTLLVVTIPTAILGTWIAVWIEPDVLKYILGIGLLAVAISFLRGHEPQSATSKEIGSPRQNRLTTATGEEICYSITRPTEGRFLGAVGGLFVGMISTGLGELNNYFFLQRCQVPSKVSVATSVFVVSLTVLTAATGHLVQFIHSGGDVLATVLSIVIFTIPGVILGAQFGSNIASHIPQNVLEKTLGILFILIAFLTLGEASL